MDQTFPACLAVHRDGTAVLVRLQPRARRTALVGRLGDRLKIAVSAPPVDGKANEELCRFLAEALSMSKGSVFLLHGDTSRQKTVLIRGLTPDQVASRLEL